MLKQKIKMEDNQDKVLPEVHAMRMVNERIMSCLRDIENKSNCIGTALFIAGERDNDWPISGSWIRDELMRLRQVKDPTIGHLVSWEAPHKGKIVICHMGVITSTDPILVTHREGPNKYVIKDQPFNDLNRYYSNAPFFCVYRFYRPKAFDLPCTPIGFR